MKTDDKGLACFGLIAYAVVIAVVGAITGGLVTVKLWGWFIAPLFALPTLSLVQAIGLSFTLSFLTKTDANPDAKGKDTLELILEGLLKVTLYPAIIVFIGWIIQLFL